MSAALLAGVIYQVGFRYEPVTLGVALYRYDRLTGQGCMLAPRNRCAGEKTLAEMAAPTAPPSVNAFDQLARPTP